MAKAISRRPRRLKREALVFAHLERVSKDLLVKHPDVVRQFIGRNTGIYALYRRGKLYYVGLATALRHRLTAHGKNQHGKQWDQFSIYLTIKDQHLREIEALLLRIAKPPGAKQTGKLAQSRDMRRQISRAIRQKQFKEVSSLFGRGVQEDAVTKVTRGDPQLVRFFPSGARLRGYHKGKAFSARARRDGQVRFDGKVYSSLTLAAKAAVKRPINGWWFWHVERGKGNWIRLTKMRKAGTPLLLR
jgi:hypothetical protein